MQRNVGRTDRTVRVTTGAALLGASLLSGPKAPLKSAAGTTIGGAMIATGATGHCPAYELADVDTLES